MDQRDTIVVRGRGRAAGAADAVLLDLRLEGHGATVGEALDQLSTATAAARAALPDHRLATHGLGVHPRHDLQGRPAGQTAYQALRVRTEEPTRAGTLVQRLADAVAGSGAGQLGVDGLRSEVSDPEPVRSRAREAAVADARAAAEDYARLADLVLGRVLWIREEMPGSPVPAGVAIARMSAAGGPEVDPADSGVEVQLWVCWEFTPRGGQPA